MAPKDGERSAASATRFTATTPHASSKRAPIPPHQKSQSVPGVSGHKPVATKSTVPPVSSQRAATETPQQRVARLRAAHEAAKNARVSALDRFLARTRPILNSAHKITVMGLVGLTVVAGVMTGYTALDMMRHNKKRQAEFLEAQKKMAADSLEAARLAYMRGEASDEQKTLVEEAQARAEGQGFKLPSILSSPTPIKKDPDETMTAESVAATVPEEGKSSRLLSLLPFWGKKEEGKDASEAEPKEVKPERTLEEKRAMLQQARAAFEKEKENQQTGGPLDRLGTAEASESSPQSKEAEQPKKKGWLW